MQMTPQSKGSLTIMNHLIVLQGVQSLAMWCSENSLSLNTNKTKDLIINFRRGSEEPAPIYIKENNIKCILGYCISTWYTSCTALEGVVSNAQSLWNSAPGSWGNLQRLLPKQSNNHLQWFNITLPPLLHSPAFWEVHLLLRMLGLFPRLALWQPQW